jgi:hypothetical protein
VLADDRTKVLRQLDRPWQVTVLDLNVSEELCVSIGAVLWPLQHQPGRPARGQRLLLQLDDAWEHLARAPLAWL